MAHTGRLEGVELEGYTVAYANKGFYIKNEFGKGTFSFQNIISKDPLYKMCEFKRNLSVRSSSSQNP